MEIPAYKVSGLIIAFSLLTPVPRALAQQTPPIQITSFSVGPDQMLTYPNSSSGANQLQGFSDLHPTFFPQAGSGPPYLVFGSAQTSLSSGNFWGAAVLQTTDLMTFDFAPGYNLPVLTSPVPYAICNPTYDTTWDENYAGPGAVLQDPTLPAGNLIMLVDAEQHCPGGMWQSPFYITVGLARSSDDGKTWPAPESGAPSRYAVLQSSDPQPTSAHDDDLGNGIPTGFIDKSASGDYYLYVAYTAFPSSGTRVARAKLGADPLTFMKWYNGSFSQPGIGGLDSDVKPDAPGCASAYPENPEISYNDDLGLYLMIFKCLSGTADAGVGGWYYSTATSLDLEDWTIPQLIQNSQYPWASCTPPPGQEFDGHLPSTLSPGAAPGHTKLTGYIFLTNKTCDLASRQFLSRTFTIAAELVPFFTGEVSLGSGVYYLQFPNANLFGYYNFVSSSIFYHYDLGFEAFIPGSTSDIYLYDFTSNHWWYTSATLFPYLYDFTLKTWIYYFPDTKNPGHYTTNPRSFSNLTTGKIFTM